MDTTAAAGFRRPRVHSHVRVTPPPCRGSRLVVPAVTETALARAERLAERVLPDRTPKRRMLVIVNPYASTVSDRLKNLVVYALQGRYQVEAVDTERRDHATQICREAADAGCGPVVAFAGDRPV